MTLATIVLAAGNATRFGSPKLLAEWHGRPLVEQALEAAPAGLRLVVLGPKTRKLRPLCAAHGFAVVVNPRPSRGLASSLALGLAHLPAAIDAAIVLLGDEPLVGAVAVERLVRAYRREGRAVAASFDGQRGHPIVIPRADWPLVPASGERPGVALDPVLVDCDDLGQLGVDVDTPDDLLALAARTAPTAAGPAPATREALEELLEGDETLAVRASDGGLDLASVVAVAEARGRVVDVLAQSGDGYVALVSAP